MRPPCQGLVSRLRPLLSARIAPDLCARRWPNRGSGKSRRLAFVPTLLGELDANRLPPHRTPIHRRSRKSNSRKSPHSPGPIQGVSWPIGQEQSASEGLHTTTRLGHFCSIRVPTRVPSHSLRSRRDLLG